MSLIVHDEDSAMAQELAKFHLSREYEIITVFRFEDLHPNTVQLWGEHVLKFKDRPIPEGTRVLYDFRECLSPPSRYIMTYHNDVLKQLTLPQDIKDAFLLPNKQYDVWFQIMVSERVKQLKATRAFLDKEEAIAWLLE